MAKKKSKSNVMLILAVFMIVLGIAMTYYSNVSGNKGVVTIAVFSIIIGLVLIAVSRKSAVRKRR